MLKKSVVLFCFVFCACSSNDKEAKPAAKRNVTGTLIEHKNFPSKHVPPRQVDVWLPSGYDASKRYAVLYLCDGQNGFDSATAHIGVDWGVDETLTRLSAEGKIEDVIAVGVWNAPNRYGEYMPQKAYEALPPSTRDSMRARYPMQKIASDAYLKFIVEELKPYIDSAYATNPEPSATAMMGSSMGGLISLYAICEYPNVFGKAACLSTHFPAGNGVVIDYLKTHLPDPKTHKIYFDFGTETLDKDYEPYQRRADSVMAQSGYKLGENWLTRKFEGDDHSERSWRKRLHVPILFLFGKQTRLE
ncbi:MAG: alpha/beta hydrolase-fold protein [Chloroherpetonaceae bacterium]|nr:alpha/beta hydrolase-fold protein [Chloroherpetonaceae bacterium]MDW8438085.1 alpha/beta hydrolase-fold protein [Chloroherpetonaceae bacterium]